MRPEYTSPKDFQMDSLDVFNKRDKIIRMSENILIALNISFKSFKSVKIIILV